MNVNEGYGLSGYAKACVCERERLVKKQKLSGIVMIEAAAEINASLVDHSILPSMMR